MHKWLSHVNNVIFRDYSFLAEFTSAEKRLPLCCKLCNHVKCVRAKVSSSMNSIAAITSRPPTHIRRVSIFQTTESPREKCGLTPISHKRNVKLVEVQQVKQGSRHRRPGNGARPRRPRPRLSGWVGRGGGRGRRRGGEDRGRQAGGLPGLCQPLLQMAVLTGDCDFGISRNRYRFLLQFLLPDRLESIWYFSYKYSYCVFSSLILTFTWTWYLC